MMIEAEGEKRLAGKRPFVSVVILTFNSASTIGACIESILRNEYPRDRYEIIIVDGGSTDGTLGILSHYPVKVITCPPGRCRARNAGIKESKGEIVAFTDADCKVGTRWLAKHVANHASGDDVMLVGGAIVDGSRSRLGHASHITMFGDLKPGSPKRMVEEIPTCNMSLKRQAPELVGFFDTRLDGVKGAAAEDTEFCWRVVKSGYKILFDPEVAIWHYPNYDTKSPSRAYFAKQLDCGVVHFRLLRIDPRFPGRLPTNPLLVTPLLAVIALMWALRQIMKATMYADRSDVAVGVLISLLLMGPWWAVGYFKAAISDRLM